MEHQGWDAIYHETRLLFPYPLYAFFVGYPLKHVPEKYFRREIFCSHCKIKGILPSDTQALFIKQKTRGYDTPSWVDDRGFIRCPKCLSYHVNNDGIGNCTGDWVYWRCNDCKYDDQENAVWVSAGL